MVPPELAEFVASGVAMLGASADATGVPEVFRIWGASYDADRCWLRALVSADAGRTLAGVDTGSRLSCTFTDIVTFRSVQLKGSAVGPATPPGPGDVELLRRYGHRFDEKLRQVGHRPTLAERLWPAAVFVVTVEVDRCFDQTPGPRAGEALRGTWDDRLGHS